MAAKKPKPEDEQGDEIERVEGEGPDDAGPVQDTPEIVALKARLAELEAENLALRSTPAEVAPAGPMKRYRVHVKHTPPRVVDATDEANAREAYKRDAGIISTEHPFEVGQVGDDVPVGPSA